MLSAVADGHEEAGLDDGPSLAKASQHGLGHLLNPTDPDDPSAHGIEQAWELLLRGALGLTSPEPPWLDRPGDGVEPDGAALLRCSKRRQVVCRAGETGQLPASGPRRPLDPSAALPIAPYESNASLWENLSWVNRRSGRPVAITTDPFDGDERPEVVGVRTYRQVLADYVAYPEAKSLGPRGEPVRRGTKRWLQRRAIEMLVPVRYIGKEGNRLDVRTSGLAFEAWDYRIEFVDQIAQWREVILPILAGMPRKLLIAGWPQSKDDRAVPLWRCLPRARNRALLAGLAKAGRTPQKG